MGCTTSRRTSRAGSSQEPDGRSGLSTCCPASTERERGAVRTPPLVWGGALQAVPAVAADEIRRREQFVLLDNQRVAYDLVLHAVDRAREADQKRVIVITGGPGSGKSVIALSLLGELARRGRTVLHATGSRSFTQTLRKVAGHRSPPTQRLFKYFNDFMAAERNGLDVLILDEAHRIRRPASRVGLARSQG